MTGREKNRSTMTEREKKVRMTNRAKIEAEVQSYFDMFREKNEATFHGKHATLSGLIIYLQDTIDLRGHRFEKVRKRAMLWRCIDCGKKVKSN